MTYANGILTIQFPKYTKRYEGVPTSVAYKLAYSKNPMSTFNSLIKNQFKNEIV